MNYYQFLTQTKQQTVTAGDSSDAVNRSDVIPPPAQTLNFDVEMLRGMKRHNFQCKTKQFRK